MTCLEVAATLESFQKGNLGKWDWEAYIEYARFKDPYLLSIQKYMYEVSTGAIHRNSFVPCEVDKQIETYILELKRRASTQDYN